MEKKFNEADCRLHYRWLRHKYQSEIRCIGVSDKKVFSWFVKTEDEFVKFCKDNSGKNQVYVGINERKENGTKIEDIEIITNFVVDIDNKNNFIKTQETALKIKEEAIAQGFKEPLLICSGNGFHIYFALEDLPNNEQTREKIKVFGKKLKVKYENEFCLIDEAVFEPARVMRVAGTMNIKPDVNAKCFILNPKVKRENDKLLTEHIFSIKPETSIIIGKLETSLAEWIEKDETIKQLFNAEPEIMKKFVSRSEAEESLVCRLISIGLNKEQLFKVMASCKIGKWQEANIQYRELTYKKAVELIDIAKKKTSEKLQVISLNQLNTLEIKPVEWIVKDLIPKKSIVIIAGKRGTFKSFGAIDLSLCVASGKPFLNVFETKEARVLYVDEENGISVLKERTDKIKMGLELQNNQEINEKIFFTSRQNIKLDSEKWREKLKIAIIDYKPDLIIIDSLRRVISFDENVAGEISSLFTDIITPLSEKYNLTWVLLHHLRKGMSGRYISDEMDELRGSSDLPNYADVVIIFDRKKGEADKFIMKQAKCRFASEIPAKLIQLIWNENNLKMECVGDAQETLFADKMVAEMIMNWLTEEQKTSFETKEALRVMTGQKQSRASVYRALDILQEGDKPKIRKVSRGKYELNVYQDLNKFSK